MSPEGLITGIFLSDDGLRPYPTYGACQLQVLSFKSQEFCRSDKRSASDGLDKKIKLGEEL